jgi:hypothetical protein
MHVERLGGERADRRDDPRAERDVGDEMPVHHVEMDPVGAGLVDGAHLVAEPGEIGRRIEGAMRSGRAMPAGNTRS